MTREAILARTMVELADNLVADFDIVDLLTTLSDRCVEIFDVDGAGIVLASPAGDLQLMTATNEAVQVVKMFELKVAEGPCLDSFRTGRQEVGQDLTAAGDRWPTFAPFAVREGFRAIDAIPMHLRSEMVGVLNLSSTKVGSLNASDVAAAQALADIATIAIIQNRMTLEKQLLNTQLESALTSRIVIEQAKGMLAGLRRISSGEAFIVLRTYARNHNLRLADVAQSTLNGTIDP